MSDWGRVQPPVCAAGDVGGDAQVGEAWSARWIRALPDGTFGVVDRAFYVACVDGGYPYVERRTEYMICTDPTDPGSSGRVGLLGGAARRRAVGVGMGRCGAVGGGGLMPRSKLQAGDRVVNPGEPVLEYTPDKVWAPVCAADDVAMTIYNDDAELCCATCGGTFREVVKIG